MGLEQVTKELRHLETWGRRYVGDHSGWHHRQVLYTTTCAPMGLHSSVVALTGRHTSRRVAQALLLRALHVSGFVDATSSVYRPDPQLYAKPDIPAPPSSYNPPSRCCVRSLVFG